MKQKLLSVLLTLALALTALPFVAAPRAQAAGRWISAWGTSIVNGSVSIPGLELRDYIPSYSTIRVEIPVTAAGSYLRFKFSNEFGKNPLTINELTVARTQGAGKAAIVSGSAAAITFGGGSTAVTIPVGQTVWSDDIYFPTAALENISVSMFFRSLTYISSEGLSNGRSFLSKKTLTTPLNSQAYADALNSPSEINISSGTITYHTIPFLSNVDTFSSSDSACSAVFIGDSTLVNNTYLHFAQRLVDAGYSNIGVVNEAIIGNKLLSKGTGLIGNLYGPSLIDRYYRDALDLAGVKYVFVKIGLNDILHQYSKSMGNDVLKCSTDDIINGYKNLVTMASERGIRVYFFTKTPWKGYARAFLGQSNDLSWSQEAQDKCDALDQWIRNNNFADGFIDGHALANPGDPNALCPSFTLDGAHLTEIASIALADLIPLSYVGVSRAGRTAAEINNVAPYTELAEIQEAVNNGTYQAKTEEKSDTGSSSGGLSDIFSGLSGLISEDTIASLIPEGGIPAIMDLLGGITGGDDGGEKKTDDKKKDAASSAETTAAPTEVSVTVVAQTDASVTIADAGANEAAQADIVGETKQIGGSGSIIFVLVLFLVILAAGVVVFLTVGKKRKSVFINR